MNHNTTHKKINKNHELIQETIADELLNQLVENGVSYLFSNSGTDFTPIIGALDRRKQMNKQELSVIVIPHENTLVSMAHGYYLLTHKMQAVMAHVNVGTANMGLSIINARRAHIPVLIMAGVTPYTEENTNIEGYSGCRTNFVQWGQDSFDQAAYFREFTKWDYQLKTAHHLPEIIARATAIANSAPAGPVYLTLPKEVLCANYEGKNYPVEKVQKSNSEAFPDEEVVEKIAEMIAGAERPLILVAELGRYQGGAEILEKLAMTFGIAVVEFGKRNFFNLSTECPMHLGFWPSPWLEESDIVIAVENMVPYIPFKTKLSKPLKIVQIAIDPLFQDIPLRSFPIDVSLAANPVVALKKLYQKLVSLGCKKNIHFKKITEYHEHLFQEAMDTAQKDGNKTTITKRYLSYCIGQVFDQNVVIFNEYPLNPALVRRTLPNSWFENSIASGLGWALGAALGAKLADPYKTIVATVGDGTMLFNTPLSAFNVASSYRIPIIIIIFNDTGWSTIKTSYLEETSAHVSKDLPLCFFEQEICYEKVAEACGLVGIRVESPQDIQSALQMALNKIQEGITVVLNVICERET